MLDTGSRVSRENGNLIPYISLPSQARLVLDTGLDSCSLLKTCRDKFRRNDALNPLGY